MDLIEILREVRGKKLYDAQYNSSYNFIKREKENILLLSKLLYLFLVKLSLSLSCLRLKTT